MRGQLRERDRILKVVQADDCRSIKSEAAPAYGAKKPMTVRGEDAIVTQAIAIIEKRFYSREYAALTDPLITRQFLKLHLTSREHELFCVIYLDNRHRVIAFEELFRGTIDGASVHPREVLKQALHHNAAALIFAHNHPSGVAEPSDADRRLTRRLKDTLALVDIQVLDHFVVGEGDPVSFAERGYL